MAYSHVLVLHTDNGSFDKTKYIIDIILALRESGIKVYFMTTTCSIKYINDVPIKLVCSWFPRTIFGYCRREMSIIRSIILALYASWYPPRGKPTYVICDGSSVTIPILKYYGNRVTFVNYIVSFHHLLTKPSDVSIRPIQISSLKRADDIIVPSEQCKAYFPGLDDVSQTVLFPCCDCNCNLSSVKAYPIIPIPNLDRIPHLFTVFGEFSKPCNFYLVLNAFKDLKLMLPEKLFNDTRLIFVGRCETLEEKTEWKNLEKEIFTSDPSIADKIYLYDAYDCKGVMSFLKYSLVLMDTTEDTLFNIMILRAQVMGIPIICFQSGFHEEVVKHEVTGVFIAKNVYAIRNSMHRFISSHHWAKKLGKVAKKDIKKMFSKNMFRQNINNLVMKCNIIKFNPYLPLEENWATPSDTPVHSVINVNTNLGCEDCLD